MITRESHATIKGMSISMTTLICSCSDLFTWLSVKWSGPDASQLSYAISLQYQSKLLTTLSPQLVCNQRVTTLSLKQPISFTVLLWYTRTNVNSLTYLSLIYPTSDNFLISKYQIQLCFCDPWTNNCTTHSAHSQSTCRLLQHIPLWNQIEGMDFKACLWE